MTELIISDKFTEEMKVELREMINKALVFFPEIQSLSTLRISRIEDGSHRLGLAELSSEPHIKLQWKPRFHTIGHEIIHILRNKKLVDIPASEFATDVFSTARDELFNDHYGSYVEYSSEIFLKDKKTYFDLMIKGTELYALHGKYKWCRLLKAELKTARDELMKHG